MLAPLIHKSRGWPRRFGQYASIACRTNKDRGNIVETENEIEPKEQSLADLGRISSLSREILFFVEILYTTADYSIRVSLVFDNQRYMRSSFKVGIPY